MAAQHLGSWWVVLQPARFHISLALRELLVRTLRNIASRCPPRLCHTELKAAQPWRGRTQFEYEYHRELYSVAHSYRTCRRPPMVQHEYTGTINRVGRDSLAHRQPRAHSTRKTELCIQQRTHDCKSTTYKLVAVFSATGQLTQMSTKWTEK